MHVFGMVPGGQLGATKRFLQFQESNNPSLAPTNLNQPNHPDFLQFRLNTHHSKV